MVFTHRIAALAAVVAIPLGIAVTSYALTDTPDDRKAPTKVELESGTPAAPGDSPSVPRDETVSPPPARTPEGATSGNTAGTTGTGTTGTTGTTGSSGNTGTSGNTGNTSAGTSASPSGSNSPSPSASASSGDDDDDDGPGGDDDSGDDG
ncbi:small secreted hydrophilic protein [Streptomyces sp. JNUCC 64]